jgi:hypothetical protein
MSEISDRIFDCVRSMNGRSHKKGGLGPMAKFIFADIEPGLETNEDNDSQEYFSNSPGYDWENWVGSKSWVEQNICNSAGVLVYKPLEYDYEGWIGSPEWRKQIFSVVNIEFNRRPASTYYLLVG